jgi:hypothetical protein
LLRRDADAQSCPDRALASRKLVSAPHRLAIEAPRPSLADLKALAAEHGYDVVRQERED